MISFPVPTRVWMFLAITLLATGCLTIEENYRFKKDGSGSMEYVVDMSEMADLMKGLPGGKTEGKDDGIGRMDMQDDLGKLKKLPGIRKVKLKKEKDGFLQRLSFRFNDINALNAALNSLMPDSTGQQHEFFRWEGNALVRTNNRHADEMSSGMGGGSGDSTDMTSMLQSMHYKYSFRFADEISDAQVAQGMAKEADGSNGMKFNTDWSVISKDPTALDLRIVLKK